MSSSDSEKELLRLDAADGCAHGLSGSAVNCSALVLKRDRSFLKFPPSRGGLGLACFEKNKTGLEGGVSR